VRSICKNCKYFEFEHSIYVDKGLCHNEMSGREETEATDSCDEFERAKTCINCACYAEERLCTLMPEWVNIGEEDEHYCQQWRKDD